MSHPPSLFQTSYHFFKSSLPHPPQMQYNVFSNAVVPGLLSDLDFDLFTGIHDKYESYLVVHDCLRENVTQEMIFNGHAHRQQVG